MFRDNNSDDGREETRRTVLKSGAAGVLGLTGVPAVVDARSRDETVYQRSLRVREQADWDNDQWRSYLESHDLEFGARNHTVEVPLNHSESGDGGASTQKYDSYECTIYMTYTYPRYEHYHKVDLEWEHDNLEFDDYPERPNDNAAISFDSRHYSPTNYDDDWVYYSKYSSDPDDSNSKTSSGAVCDWGDAAAGQSGYFGLRLDPNTDYDYTERQVFFDYVHTWSGSGLSGVSVGPSGISMQFSSNTDRWDVEDMANEKQLLDGEQESG